MTALQFYPQLTFFIWCKKIWKKSTPKKYSLLSANLNFISWNVIEIKHIFIVKGFLIVAGQMCWCMTFCKNNLSCSDLVSESTTSNNGKRGIVSSHLPWTNPQNLVLWGNFVTGANFHGHRKFNKAFSHSKRLSRWGGPLVLLP